MTAVPKNKNSMAVKLRRMVLLDRARTALGGAAPLAEAMGIGRRAVSHKLAAERGLTDMDLAAVAMALDAQAARVAALAADIRAVLT